MTRERDTVNLADVSLSAELLLHVLKREGLGTIRRIEEAAASKAAYTVKHTTRNNAVRNYRVGVLPNTALTRGTPAISVAIENDEMGALIDARIAQRSTGKREGELIFQYKERWPQCDHVLWGRNYFNTRSLPECDLKTLRTAISDLRGYQ